jgi:hypothetical protein
MRNKLSIPVLIYRNLYYSEPWDASQAVMRMHPDWQLRGADGKPINPEGKLVYNMSNPEVSAFYTSVVANLSAEVSDLRVSTAGATVDEAHTSHVRTHTHAFARTART